MSTFHDLLQADRRLSLLRTLTDAPNYTANQYLLQTALAAIGHDAPHDTIRADLGWLAEQGLVINQFPGGVWVATLTLRGQDVAAGRAVIPGVKRPMAGG
jgi:hypothetical protein